MKRFLKFRVLVQISLAATIITSCNTPIPEVHGMFMNNPQHSSYYKSVSVKTKPELVWKVETGGQVISSPIVVDNVLYIGSDDQNLYAINAQSGEVIWQFETSGAIRSTPLVAYDKVMFLSYDGFFYALNKANGLLAWKFETGGESVFNVKDYYNGEFQPDFWDFYLSSAVADDSAVYFGSSDSSVYALDIRTGEMNWRYKTGGSIHSSPALWEKSLIVGSWDSRVYCLDTETGNENWSYTTGRDTTQYIWLGIQASPSISEETVFIGSRDAKFYAFDISTGDTIWVEEDFNLSWMPSSAAIGDSTIYTGSSDAFSFYAIDRKTGEIAYSTSTRAYTFSTPAIDSEMAYIGSSNGRLYGVDLRGGTIEWQFQTSGSETDTLGFFNPQGDIDDTRATELTNGITTMPDLTELYTKIFINSGAILSSPAVVDQVIYFGSCDGNIYAISNNL